MRFIPLNELGMLMSPTAVLLALVIGAGEVHHSALGATILLGLPCFLLDAGYRLWRCRPEQDIILFIFADTGGAQLFGLPLWVWSFVLITTSLTQSTVFVPFGIALALADLAYRTRLAVLERRSWRSMLMTSRGTIVPLWLLACMVIALAL